MRISSAVLQNNSDNPPHHAGTDTSVKGIKGEVGESKAWKTKKKNPACCVFSSGFEAKWDVCPVYHLWEPVAQVCAALVLIDFDAVLLTPLGIRFDRCWPVFLGVLCRLMAEGRCSSGFWRSAVSLERISERPGWVRRCWGISVGPRAFPRLHQHQRRLKGQKILRKGVDMGTLVPAMF